MRTVVLGPRPAELQALIELRRARGADRHDEVWEGEYHMAPAPHPHHGYVDDELAAALRAPARAAGLTSTSAFNLGTADDYRVPDRGLHRELPTATFAPTAVLVVEIVSPGDESWAKLAFFAAHGVQEVVIADPTLRSLTWLVREGEGFVETARSGLLDLDVVEVAAQIDWPHLP